MRKHSASEMKADCKQNAYSARAIMARSNIILIILAETINPAPLPPPPPSRLTKTIKQYVNHNYKYTLATDVT